MQYLKQVKFTKKSLLRSKFWKERFTSVDDILDGKVPEESEYHTARDYNSTYLSWG